MSTAAPFEHREGRPIPETLELCARCLLGLIHRRGPDLLPYSPPSRAEPP